jgi:hypothetical protein
VMIIYSQQRSSRHRLRAAWRCRRVHPAALAAHAGNAAVPLLLLVVLQRRDAGKAPRAVTTRPLGRRQHLQGRSGREGAMGAVRVGTVCGSDAWAYMQWEEVKRREVGSRRGIGRHSVVTESQLQITQVCPK